MYGLSIQFWQATKSNVNSLAHPDDGPADSAGLAGA